MNMKKVFKIIAIILFLIVLLLLVNTIRKTVILSKLQNNVAKYIESNNYCIKKSFTMDNGTTMTIDYYQKDKKQTLIMNKKSVERRNKNINV